MPILYDARGNEWSGAIDQITNGTLTDARTPTATIVAAAGEVIMDLAGHAVALVHVAAGLTGTLVFEGTVDGTNYFQIPGQNVQTEALVMSLVNPTAAVYAVGVTGFRRFRVRCSAWTSGSVVIAMRATRADFAIYMKAIPTNLWVTATAAVNTAATATLPAAAAGLFHYITRIKLEKLYNVVGVAAGAGVLVTTTNLAGSPVWTTPQNASPAGAVETVIDENFTGNPLKSSVAATATTFVAPLQLQTIWRWNVGYYVGA